VIIGVSVAVAVVVIVVIIGILLWMRNKQMCLFKPAGNFVDIEDPLLKADEKDDV